LELHELALSEQSKMKVCPLCLLAGITKKSATDAKTGLIWMSDCAGKPPSKQQFLIIEMFPWLQIRVLFHKVQDFESSGTIFEKFYFCNRVVRFMSY
jgi:hypothetical protein